MSALLNITICMLLVSQGYAMQYDCEKNPSLQHVVATNTAADRCCGSSKCAAYNEYYTHALRMQFPR